MGSPEIVILGVVALAVWAFTRHQANIQEAIENFRDQFRGGPPTGMHPSPADDRVLTNRNRKAKRSV